ncbi:MAG: hypothetical protein K5872_21555 [Rhizobiaceae bacterium]|nr:hypothetical protein [Rhizobiaceae bacterium]MCV0408805.1 hypothetical protein [Rhizobiaceae bacterium]
MYASLPTWLAIVAGGVAGCLGLWLVLFLIARVPFGALGGHPGKQLWSVLFMVPVPAILDVAGRAGILFEPALAIALAWLALAPSTATKLYFDPETAGWGRTIGLNLVYGVIALAVYYQVLLATIMV